MDIAADALARGASKLTAAAAQSASLNATHCAGPKLSPMTHPEIGESAGDSQASVAEHAAAARNASVSQHAQRPPPDMPPSTAAAQPEAAVQPSVQSRQTLLSAQRTSSSTQPAGSKPTGSAQPEARAQPAGSTVIGQLPCTDAKPGFMMLQGDICAPQLQQPGAQERA